MERVPLDIRRVFADERVREVVEALRGYKFEFMVSYNKDSQPVCQIDLGCRTFVLCHCDITYKSPEEPCDYA